jgi:hypothetical protein
MFMNYEKNRERAKYKRVHIIVINIIIITIIVMFDRARGMQNDVTKRKIARARVRTEIFAYTYICSRDRVNDTQREKNNKKETHTYVGIYIYIYIYKGAVSSRTHIIHRAQPPGAFHFIQTAVDVDAIILLLLLLLLLLFIYYYYNYIHVNSFIYRYTYTHSQTHYSEYILIAKRVIQSTSLSVDSPRRRFISSFFLNSLSSNTCPLARISLWRSIGHRCIMQIYIL